MDKRPVLLITAGDPAGIGPEVCLKALADKGPYKHCIPVVIGDTRSLTDTRDMLGARFTLRRITHPREAGGLHGVIEYMDAGSPSAEPWRMGAVSAEAGRAAYAAINLAIDLALAGHAGGVVTAPVNKEALHLAGCPFPGHTEIFASRTGARDYAMVLVAGALRVIHVTTHMSLRDACAAITAERVLRTLRLARRAMEDMDCAGTIGVAGLNPHSSDNGLFGDEESRAIIPAIEQARAEGMDVDGPVPPDTVFVKALSGSYAIVAAMYHDQGHIPVKLAGFRRDGGTGAFTEVGGVNCTVGLPIIRTSVDHGTAFDVAGRGVANAQSMRDALEMAARMALKEAVK